MENEIIKKMPLLKVERIQHRTPLREVNVDNKNIYLCCFCRRKFGLKFLKQKHEKFCTRNPMVDESILRKRYCCENCGSSFKHKRALDAHIKFNCCNKSECKKGKKKFKVATQPENLKT